MIYVAAVLGLLALLAIPLVAVLRLAIGEGFFGGQATTIVLLLLMSSFQLFFLFILGQYVARTYDETRNRPLYVVADKRGFDDAAAVPLMAHERESTPEGVPHGG
jgi:dolichol-phosphate mannosyltransferase